MQRSGTRGRLVPPFTPRPERGGGALRSTIRTHFASRLRRSAARKNKKRDLFPRVPLVPARRDSLPPWLKPKAPLGLVIRMVLYRDAPLDGIVRGLAASR